MNFYSIYIPLVLQNIITLSVNLADNIMLGAYSETALAGVAAVNQIQFVYQQLIMALGDGLVMFGSQYWGRGQVQPIKKITASAMYGAVTLAAVLFALASLFPRQTVGIFTTDSMIIGEGAAYLGIIRFTYVFFAVTQLLLAAVRSTETVKIASCLSVLTFCINCGMNYMLIFGHFGAPQLGVQGAAIGTLLARMAESAALVFYIWKREQKLKLRFRDFLQFDWKLLKKYYRLTAPMLVVQGLWGVNTALQTVILGHMTAAAIAANSAASTLFLMVKSASVGAASAAAVIIGKATGTGDLAKVREYSGRLQKKFLVIGVLSGVFLYVLRIPVLGLYDLSPETMKMADTFLIILSVICVGMSYQMPTNSGIIRGGGNALFVVKMDLISIWGIVLPLSFIMAFVVKASPAVVVCCLNADQIFKCVPAYLESHYGNWVRRLV